MDQLSSKLCKNENNRHLTLTDIFNKINENLLKYYTLNLFKEIAIDFNQGLQTSWKSPAKLSDSLLVQIRKYCR